MAFRNPDTFPTTYVTTLSGNQRNPLLQTRAPAQNCAFFWSQWSLQTSASCSKPGSYPGERICTSVKIKTKHLLETGMRSSSVTLTEQGPSFLKAFVRKNSSRLPAPRWREGMPSSPSLSCTWKPSKNYIYSHLTWVSFIFFFCKRIPLPTCS